MGYENEVAKDYFRAALEGEELVMEPCCVCGNHLDEEYFCEDCKRQCSCTEIRCTDQTTLEHINRLLNNNESFRHFTAVLEQDR